MRASAMATKRMSGSRVVSRNDVALLTPALLLCQERGPRAAAGRGFPTVKRHAPRQCPASAHVEATLSVVRRRRSRPCSMAAPATSTALSLPTAIGHSLPSPLCACSTRKNAAASKRRSESKQKPSTTSGSLWIGLPVADGVTATLGAPVHRRPSASVRPYVNGIDAQAFRRRRRRRRRPPPSSRTDR